MKHPRSILSLFLLLGLGSGVYLWWRLSDQQVVQRQVDALCETASKRLISLGDENQPVEMFRSLIDEQVTLSGSIGAPNGTFSADELTAELRRYRAAARSAKARRLESDISFPAPDEAIARSLLEHEATWIDGSKTLDRIRATLEFRKGPDGWILTKADFREAPGK